MPSGAQSTSMPSPIASRALQDELRDTKRRLKAGGGAGLPKPGRPGRRRGGDRGGRRAVDRARRGVRVDRRAQGRSPRTLARRSTSGVIALALDADEPQLFVTVSRRPRRRAASPPATSSARRCPRSTARAAAGRRWPRARARAGRARRRARRDRRPSDWRDRRGGLMAFWRRIWQRDERERWPPAPRSTSGRSSPRRSSSRSTTPGTGRSRASAQAPGPHPHAVGHRRRHRGGRRQLCGRPPGSGGDGRLPADPGRHRHRRRAGQGLHDDPQPGAQAARPADQRGRAPEAHRRRPARGAARGRASDHLGDRAAARRRPPGPRGGHRRVHRRLRADQPGRVPGPARQDRHLQRVRAAGPPRRAADASPASWTWSCSRSSPSRTPSPACSGRSRSASPARCSSTSAAARPTSRSSAGAASRAPGCSRSVGGRSPRAWPTAWTCRSRGPKSCKVDYARGLEVDERDEVAAIIGDDVRVWAAGVELVMEELSRR